MCFGPVRILTHVCHWLDVCLFLQLGAIESSVRPKTSVYALLQQWDSDSDETLPPPDETSAVVLASDLQSSTMSSVLVTQWDSLSD